MIALGALKVAAVAAALGLLLYVMVRLWVCSLSMDEKLAISLVPDHLTRNHLPVLVIVIIAVLCGVVAAFALLLAAVALAVGA